MATHSSILAWRIPGTEEPGGLPSLGSHRVVHDWSDLAAAAAIKGEKAMAPHSSTLAWKIGLRSTGSRRVRHDWATSLSLFTFMHWRRKWQPTPVFVPGESQGLGSLVGCHLGGRRVRHNWSDLPAAAAVAIKGRGLYVHVKNYDQHISKRIRGAEFRMNRTEVQF